MVKELTWTTAEAQEVKTDAAALRGYLGVRDSKFQRNLNRYFNNGKGAVDSIYTMYTIAQGYQPSYTTRDGIQTSINVIKSCVDTVVSKISQAKVRPYLNPVGGDYETIRACREGRKFFDAFYESSGVYKQCPDVMRDAMVFEVGIFHLDNEEIGVRRALPWDVYIDPAEFHYGGQKALSRGMLVEREYPARTILKRYPNIKDKVRLDWKSDKARYELSTYYDGVAHKKYQFYNGEVFRVTEYAPDRMPFAFLFWTRPIKGFQSTSLVDELYTIQCNIDEIQLRIDSASRRGLFNTTFIPDGGGIKESKLSNDAGLLVNYRPGPQGGQPVVSTPPAISPQFIEMLNLYISKAYEIAGVSQVNAQGKIPSNIKSGVMLDTLDDLQSDRHNVTLQSYIQLLLDVADVAIDVFPDDAEILPASPKRSSIRWKDLKKQRDLFNLQFSAGSSLSKDPATKIEQIQQLQGLGLNLGPDLPTLLEMPDLESAYSLLTASRDYVMEIIDVAAIKGEIEFAPIVDLEMLYTETVRTITRIAADRGNDKVIDNLKKLLNKIEEIQAKTQPAPETAPAETAPVGAMVPPVPAPIV